MKNIYSQKMSEGTCRFLFSITAETLVCGGASFPYLKILYIGY